MRRARECTPRCSRHRSATARGARPTRRRPSRNARGRGRRAAGRRRRRGAVTGSRACASHRARDARARGAAVADGHRQRDARLVLGRRACTGRWRTAWSWPRRCCAAGADVIDIGGESGVTNRPPVSPEEEIERVVPLIERVAGDLGCAGVGRHVQAAGGARGDRGRCGDRQRRQRPARSRARRRLRRDRRRAGADAHARGAQAEAARSGAGRDGRRGRARVPGASGSRSPSNGESLSSS